VFVCFWKNRPRFLPSSNLKLNQYASKRDANSAARCDATLRDFVLSENVILEEQ
jgi:hypothetical protein